MSNLSNSELIKAISTNKDIRSKIKALLKKQVEIVNPYRDEGSIYTDGILKLGGIEGLYMRSFLATRVGNDYIGYTNTRRIREGWQEDIINFPDLDWDVPFYQQLSDETYIGVVDEREQRRESKRRTQARFDKEAKPMALNAFSLAVFAKSLSSGRKLPGTEAMRYIALIPRKFNQPKEQEVIRNKYLKIIWDQSRNKTNDLIKTMNGQISRVGDEAEMPYFCYDDRYMKQNDSWAEATRFSYYFITSFASIHHIPLQIHTHYVSESRIHDYVTGVPKKTPMTNDDIIYAIDKLKVLHYLNAIDQVNCPYPQMAIDQITTELQRQDNKELASKILAQHNPALSQSLAKVNETLTTIKEHHEHYDY